jgi:hypothetical protein
MKAGFDRPLRDLQNVGYLLQTQAFQIVEHNHHLLRKGKGTDSLPDSFLYFPLLHHPLYTKRGGPVFYQFTQQDRPALPVVHPIATQVDSYPVEPGPYRSIGAEALSVGEEPNEALLKNVLRGSLIPGNR